MNGAVTVTTTSPALSSRINAKKVRAANSSSEAPRRTSAAFPAIRFLMAITRGLPGPVCEAGNTPGEPDSTMTSWSTATRQAISAMIAAVVLGSGG